MTFFDKCCFFHRLPVLMLLSLVVLVSACEKQMADTTEFAVLNVYGAITDKNYIVTNFKGAEEIQYFRTASKIGTFETTGSMNKYHITDPVQPLAFYAFPDTMPGDKPVLNLQLEMDKGAVYTLFLAGPANSLDTVFFREQFPTIDWSDSVGYIRFVNLCNDDPISINLKGEPYGSVVQSLPYQGVMSFLSIPVRHDIDTYEFEIRDAVTGDLLLTDVLTNVSGNVNSYMQYLHRYNTHVLTGFRGVTSGNNRLYIRTMLQ